MARNFTPEQEEKIFNNVRKIEECLQEFQTQIDEPVSAYFNTHLNGRASFDKLYISKNSMYIYVEGGRNRYFNINNANRPRWYNSLFSTCIYDDVWFALYFIANWKDIKKIISYKIAVQNEKKERIDNAINHFEV